MKASLGFVRGACTASTTERPGPATVRRVVVDVGAENRLRHSSSFSQAGRLTS